MTLSKEELSGLAGAHAMTEREVSSERVSALLPVDGLEVVMEKICRKEQIGIWANEITSALALSDFLREEWTFDDSVDLEREIAAQLLDIVKAAFTHPGLDLVAPLSQASSVIAGQKDEIADLRDEWQAEYDTRLAANTARRAAEARISSLEEEIKRLREALEAAKVWHEAEDKALSKQPPSSGPNGNAWARLQHQEQMREIETALLPTTEDHNG